MKELDFELDSDITQAHTLPASFYRDANIFEQIKETIFARSWHCIGLSSNLEGSEKVEAFSLLEGFLNEPLLLTRDEASQLHCLSNVCTHRANLVVTEGGSCKQLRCRYHGRQWDLNGEFKSMPEFKDAKNFPTKADNLSALPLHTLGDLLFTSINAQYDFADWIKPVTDRLQGLDFNALNHAPEYSQSYSIQANWAVYCDNYLEGFHIPFVHKGLNEVLSYPDYTYETFPYGSLQVGIAKDGQAHFEWPEAHPDHGKRIAAYYFWLFPNIMMNFYPWGLSLNIVEPISISETRVRFESFLLKEELYNTEEQDLIHITELEDQAIVESVQRGIQSRLYNKGRFSPTQEVGIHHFHHIISTFLKKN